MNCPGCGTDGSTVFKTIDAGKYTRRMRRCKCGGQWTTNERPEQGSFKVVVRPLVAGKEGSTHKSDQVSDPPLSPKSSLPLDQIQTRVEQPEPAVFAGFLLSSGHPWDLTESVDASLAGSFPEIDRLDQYAKAAGWLFANPAKRKTAKGMPRFLYNWLASAVSRGTARPKNGTPAGGTPFRSSRTDGNVGVLSDWLNSKGAA